MAFLSHFNNVSECGISPVNVINSGVPRLYMLSLRCAVNNYSTFYKYNTVKNLSPVVYVDLFRVALEAQNINLLCREMKFDTVCRLLCIPGMEDYLIPCFQTVIEQGVPLHKTYSCAYQEINLTGDSRERKDVAEMGINLGSFLYVCGYFEESMMVLNKCKDILRGVRSSQDFENVVMKSFYKLLMVQASSMEVRSGNETMMDMMEFMEGLRYTTTNVNDIPLIYTSISMLYQSRSEYDKAYKWAKKAVLSVRMDTDASILPEVLGKAARACSDERDYERSLELIKLAISCAKVAYGERHHKYADTLIDYAYCLLNADNIIKSAYVCQKGLSLLLTTFGNRSMRTAIAEQDMAYIKYALNYSAVVGEDAMYRIESALETMNKLMKPNSLWFAHAYRTKALILEEKEYADILMAYGRANGVATEAQRIYQERYPNRRLPNRRAFSNTYRCLRETGNVNTVAPRIPVMRHDVRIDEEILAIFEDEPTRSVRNVASILGISIWKVWNVLRENNKHPFHSVQGLEDTDFVRRVRFCRFLLDVDIDNPDFLNSILWTDECQFNREGILNLHNLHHWAPKNRNPRVKRPRSFQRRFSVNVWAGVIGNQVIGPFYLPDILNGDNYLEFLLNDLPELIAKVPIFNQDRAVIFQNDGCPAHWRLAVREYLNTVFPNSWIGRGGPIPWPPRSPDITPLVFYVWGRAKELVYVTEVESREDLTQRIEAGFGTIRREIQLNITTREIRKRCRTCIRHGGQPFEHLL